MSYSNFLDLISNGFTLFYNSASAIFSYMFTNYFYITLIGLSIFVSLLFFVKNLIISSFDNTLYTIDSKKIVSNNIDNNFIAEDLAEGHPSYGWLNPSCYNPNAVKEFKDSQTSNLTPEEKYINSLKNSPDPWGHHDNNNFEPLYNSNYYEDDYDTGYFV